ncbi:MAG: epoxyqueuosine reductase QueH [Proteobacteria bacterium]|nr:epoxyqueuosine reductase QueH [Pseudomonadota bacterium]MBU1709370.1 epoxyqueuosine reductase QueH [Pseudomonadota bacterium]
MKLLLHVCCGPCTVYPLEVLRDEGISVQGYFHNPNIHPFREFTKRLQTVEDLGHRLSFKVDCDSRYGLREYLRQVVFHEEGRCRICYEMRLLATVLHARETGADAFTTTLLYSRYQNHQAIREIAERLATEHGIPFYYRDFREGWQEGIDLSVAMGLYRQSYCGCIYSEQERYDRKSRKKQRVKESI